VTSTDASADGIVYMLGYSKVG